MNTSLFGIESPAFEGLRNERFKYVRYVDHDQTEFLHDLKHDPDELVNLAGDAAHVNTLKAMRDRTSARVSELGGALLPRRGAFTTSTVPYPVAAAAVSAGSGKDGFVRVFDGRSLRGWTGDLKPEALVCQRWSADRNH